MDYTSTYHFVIYYFLWFLTLELRPVSGPQSCRTYWLFFSVIHSSVAARSKAWLCGHSLFGIAGSNPTGDRHVCLSVVSVVCYQVEVSASGWSLVQKSPTERVVPECDHEASIRRRSWPNRGWCAMKNHRLSHPNIFPDILKPLKNVVVSCMAEYTGNKQVVKCAHSGTVLSC